MGSFRGERNRATTYLDGIGAVMPGSLFGVAHPEVGQWFWLFFILFGIMDIFVYTP